jgi:hypothetical protein
LVVLLHRLVVDALDAALHCRELKGRAILPAGLMDPLLSRFVDAMDEAEVQRELDTLVEQHALPLAKAIVARKLRTYREDKPGRSDVEDREDVIADAMVTLVERLRAARSDPHQAPIDNFVSYSATVIHSACAHHIRRGYPERARLKNRLRYVFSADRRLAVWTADDDELVCGLAEWRGRSSDLDAERALRGSVGRIGRWADMKRPDLTVATIDLVAAIGGPVDFETFVREATAAAGVVEPRQIGDPSVLPSRELAHDLAIDQRRFLARVWKEVGDLPVRQRMALLLSLRDARGAGLLWLLPVAGVATIREIAQLLEIQETEFAALWREIPLDDANIGLRLECTRQQVINLRMAARKRLTNRLGGTQSSATGGRRPKANLTPVSPSLKGSA